MKLIRTYFNTFKTFCIQYKFFIICCFLLFILLSVNDLIIYNLQGMMSGDAVLLKLDSKKLVQFLVIICVISFFKIALSTFKIYMIETKKNKISKEIKEKMGEFFTRMKQETIDKNGIGGLLSIVMNDVPFAVDFLAGRTLNFLYGLVGVFVSFIYMFYINNNLTIFFFILFLFVSYIQNISSKPVQETMKHVSIAKSDYNTMASDMFYNTEIITAYSLEAIMEENYQKEYQKYYKVNKNFLIKLVKSLTISSIMAKLPIYGIYITASYSVLSGHMTFGNFITYIIVTEIVSGWLSMIMENLSYIRMDMASTQRAETILKEDAEPIVHLCDVKQELYKQSKLKQDTAIELNHVSFSYNRVLFDNVTMKVKQGEHIAVIGESGIGKSTLLKLILGLIECQEGHIKVFGTEVEKNHLFEIRECISYVTQSSNLIPTSIREEITLGKTIHDKEIETVCKKLGIWNVINKLPKGLDTLVADGGVNFSGGEKQRILIARAVLQDKPILLLDEPVSALDDKNADDIQYMIETMLKDKTVIIVTHRNNILKMVDHIYEIREGKLYETKF